MKDFQRSHESLLDTTKRLVRKYGREQLLTTVHRVYEETGGINYTPVTKELPIKFISLAQAAEEFKIPNSTLVKWIVEGWLHNVGKWEHPEQPESSVVLVDPREVEKLKEKAQGEVEGPKLITLMEAAKIFDLSYGTLRSWRRSGRLLEKGRDPFPTKGGGKILVDEKDVIRLKDRLTPKKTTD